MPYQTILWRAFSKEIQDSLPNYPLESIWGRNSRIPYKTVWKAFGKEFREFLPKLFSGIHLARKSEDSLTKMEALTF